MKDLRFREIDLDSQPGLTRRVKSRKRTAWKMNAEAKAFFTNTFKWLSESLVFASTSRLYNREASISQISLLGVVKEYLVKAYGFDGYNPSTRQVTSADGKTSNVWGIPFGFIVLSFFGIPNRPESVIDGIPTFSFMQFLRGFIGGWNPVKETISGKVVVNGNVTMYEDSFAQKRWTEKKIFLGFLLSFKILVIVPFKLITIPFKTLLNVVKLVTEVLFPLVSFYTALINTYMVYATVWLAKALVNYTKRGSKVRISFNPLRMIVLIPLIPMAVLTLAVGIVQYTMLWACRIGLALTSSEKSARLAFAAGYDFPVANTVIKNIIGGMGAVLSLALSAVLWTITLPLALGALTTVFPAILTAINWVAQLPFVASSLAWFSQLPVITASTALLNSFFATVGGALTFAFGPAVTALAGIISVQVSPVVMAVGTTLGLIVAPIAAVLSRVADELSNRWAKWVEQAPLASAMASAKAFLFRKRIKSDSPHSTFELREISSTAPSTKLSADKNGSDHEALLAGEAVPKKQAYVYYPHEGIYIISEKPLFLVYELKKAEEAAQKFLVGIQVKGSKAEELFDRAYNVELKGLFTQGIATPETFVRYANATTGEGTRENPFVLGN